MMRVSPTGEILLANARAEKLLALNGREDLDFAEVIEGLGRPIDEWLLDVSEGRGTGRTEVVRAALPAQDVYLQVSLGRMVEHGEVSILVVLIDATELKTLEAQFVQSQKMQAIGQLAGGVAHDFNNLLTAISGHCDLLLLRHEPGDPNYGDLIQINQNANRAASLVGQLLAFSRKQNLQPEMIDLRETLVDLTHLLNRLVGEKIHLRWTHDPDLPRVRADKRQLEQVIMNLVVNARDAMPGGGTIHVETTTQTLQDPLYRDRAEVPQGSYVIVKVLDEGCGIAPDKLQKIFEPFYSTKKTGEGTGLGLSMAYGIVKQSGGFIFADSVVGKGSTFTMFFPAHRDSEVLLPRAKEKNAKSVAPQKGGHVLLVEDEAPVRAFASRALRLRGYTVTEAACAEDALEILDDKGLHIDVFVTDVVMPGMDGPTWVTKALEARPDVKVVFVSGYAEDSVSHNRAKIPNSSFLPKPFSLNQLTETVQAQLS
jgi:two-component system cell cycle sensor histidine kinase/response regulator CckA